MKKLLFIILTFLSVAVDSQTLYIPTNPDSIVVPINLGGTVRRSYVVDLTKNRVSLTKHTTDSTTLRSLINTNTLKAGLRFVLSSSAPSDTTAAWVDTSINILRTSPIRFRINGAWTDSSSNSGLYYDRIGGVISNGPPYKIFVGGQSNPTGPYIAVQSNPNDPPYSGYYGDTIPDPHVVGWNDTTHLWEVGHIARNGSPWQYSSGANYMMLLGKLIAKSTGRSVRIVCETRGGTALEAWSGSIPSGTPDTAYMFLQTKAKILRSGMTHPDLMIWGHGEGGITNNGSGGIYYYDKLLQFYDTLRREHLIDTTTIILTHGIGDPAYNAASAVGIAYAEGGLRATQYDKDIYTGYVSTKDCQSDGLHFTPKGHEDIARRFFAALKNYPLDPTRNQLGFRDTSIYSGITDTRKLVVNGLQFVATTGKPYLDMGSSPTFQDPFASVSGSQAGLFLNSGANTVTLKGYNGNTFTWDATPRWISQSAPIVANSYLQAYASFNPYLSISDLTSGKDWKLKNTATTNTLAISYRDINKAVVDTNGNLTLAGSLGPTYGGTGLTSYTTGDLLYASGTNTLAKLAIGTTRQKLSNVGGVPAWVDSTAATSYTFSTGLTNSANTITSNLSTGIATGQRVVGGTAANDTLTVQGNTASASNTATNANIRFRVGNGGATVAASILNNGNIGLGSITAPVSTFEVPGISTTSSIKAGTLEMQSFGTNNAWLGDNVYYNSGFLRRAVGYSCLFYFNGQEIQSRFAGTSTAGSAFDNGGVGYVIFKVNYDGTVALGSNAISNAVGNYTGAMILANNTGVSVGTGAAATSKLQVSGSFAAAYVAKATSYTATISDNVIEITATGQTITLPTAVGITGRFYTVKLSASGSGTVATTSSQTIDGSTTYSLSAQYKYVTVQSNGANWNIIGNN